MERKQQRRRQRKNQIRRQRIFLAVILLCLLIPAMLLLTQCKRTNAAETAPADSTGSAAPGDAAALPALPEGWQWRQMTERELAEGTLVLVNRQNGFDPALPQTVTVYGNQTDSYLVKDASLSVAPETMDALNRWMDAFADESGKTDVNIVAGWRSYADQEALYQNAVNTRGQAHADAYLALPGHSEHHTGLAVDLSTYQVEDGTSGDFDGKGVYAWAVEHAWEYGFVQRYPPEKRAITGIDYESWHFRYVGLPHAYVMTTEDLCLEEYVDWLRGYTFFGDHLTLTCLGQSYEVYFCPADRVVVPTDGSYAISGNNVDGFVVTVFR